MYDFVDDSYFLTGAEDDAFGFIKMAEQIFSCGK